jgi:hypothetical protein
MRHRQMALPSPGDDTGSKWGGVFGWDEGFRKGKRKKKKAWLE